MVKHEIFDEATKLKSKLGLLVMNRTDAMVDDILTFGRNLRSQNRCLKSLAIFEVAVFVSTNRESSKNCAEVLCLCVQEVMVTSEILIANEENMKKLVKHQVIPLMRETVKHLKYMPYVERKCRNYAVAMVLHYTEWCLRLVDSWLERKRTLKTAINCLRATFNSSEEDRVDFLWGTLHHNLGQVYESVSKVEKATRCYTQAMCAHSTFEKAALLYKHLTDLPYD